MKTKSYFIFISLLSVFSTQLIFAQDQDKGSEEPKYGVPTWGIEFTFTNQTLITEGNKNIATVNSDANEKALEIWAQMMTKICAERIPTDPEKCSVRPLSDKYGVRKFRVYYKGDKFSYDLTMDPLVIEINATPLTLERAKALKGRLQKDIFDIAKKIDNNLADAKVQSKFPFDIGSSGLIPHKRIGNGHLHIGKVAFQIEKLIKKKNNRKSGQDKWINVLEDDTLLFQRFVSDYWNHPTLSMGGLGLLPTNSPPLGILPNEQREKAMEIFENLKKKTDLKQKLIDSIALLATDLENLVYTKTWCTMKEFAEHPKKYQALNFSRLTQKGFKDENQTLEIRGIRPQRDADDFILMLELFEARLNLLKKKEGVTPYQNNFIPAYNRDVQNPQRVLSEFHDYVTGAGLDWEKYKGLLSVEFLDSIKEKNLIWDGEKTLTMKRKRDDLPPLPPQKRKTLSTDIHK